MLKRILPICILLVLMLQSCGTSYRLSLPRELKHTVSYVYVKNEDGSNFQDENGNSVLEYVLYQDTIYYLDTKSIFAPDETDLTVFIGWCGVLGGVLERWAYIHEYYANQKDTPIYIYDKLSYEVFLRNDYDFDSDLFTVEGTDLKLSMHNVLIGEKQHFDCPKTILATAEELLLCSDAIPALKIPLTIFMHENNWYAVTKNGYLFPTSTTCSVWDAYSVSDEFIQILLENGIISSGTD